MPKRVIDGEAMWSSDKLHACPMWARREYPWLYSLADAFGNFELNLRVVAAKLHPNRPDLTEKRLGNVFAELNKHGLAFIWCKNGKAYVHWSGSEAPGRLPTASRRSKRYEKQLSPPMPQEEYQSYLKIFRENNSVQHPNESLRSALALASASVSASEKQPAQASPSQSGFSTFWDKYPRKVGKPSALRAWNRIRHRTNLMEGLEAWKQTEQWQVVKHIPHPATFLNDRRWEDEPPEEIPMPLPHVQVGRGPQPAGEIRPLPAEVQTKLDEKHRKEEISRLERVMADRRWPSATRKICREQLEKLRAKDPEKAELMNPDG